ncbi:DUF2478 domain-containing protein [Xinfangfangia sp. D13-10-4-6]|uniref:DUF2478 domain-containing protein n=1 Tax=Pseudogemmobacter hezensis TaxID=2737662 RepID=UPI00155642C6|nr:DUF2478 domain-containing protein [Pseudogemmobacter hezensis]NPD13620.1 DUF2478 domain-containing protein [Pseudogemmobacter hezensis]
MTDAASDTVTDTIRLGYIAAGPEGETDLLLRAVSDRLIAAGLSLAGTVQINTLQPGRSKSDMDLFLLPQGPQIRISLDRGDAAKGCRLDTSALEEAAVIVAQRLEAADVLMVNKFGKQEADGHGLADSVAAALTDGKPVLCGMADHFLEGFLNYASGHATELPRDADQVFDWVLTGHRARLAG